MASFTITVADADIARVAQAALEANQYQPPPSTLGGYPAFRPPAGASNAATIKAWAIELMVLAVLNREVRNGAGMAPPPPVIT